MVKRYIQQTRTIILTVDPCNSDVANQNILRLAAEVDSNGERILGVLTKPDLAIENATKAVVCDHVKDKRGDLHLGYCVVKSPGADDKSGTMNKRHSQERALFGEAPWNTLPTNRLVIPALRIRLEQLLMNHTRAEFLLVKDEIRSSLKKREELLKDLGESRSTTDQQRVYVGKIASEFMRITHYGLDAYYRRHSIFEDAEMRLITRIEASTKHLPMSCIRRAMPESSTKVINKKRQAVALSAAITTTTATTTAVLIAPYRPRAIKLTDPRYTMMKFILKFRNSTRETCAGSCRVPTGAPSQRRTGFFFICRRIS